MRYIKRGRRATASIGLVALSLVVTSCARADARDGEDTTPADGRHQIELTVLEDKIRGGWACQMIGVSFGAPTEFQYLGRIIPAEALPEWRPEMVRGALDQDDLYVDITLAEVLDEHGLDATSEDFGARFRDAGYALWHGNLAARRGRDHVSLASSTAGAEAVIRFRGTGAILTGWYLPTGGLADVYLDGELSRTVDVHPDEDDVKFGESVWHGFGLADAEHELRLVVRGKPYPGSRGADVTITHLTVFRP